MRGLGGGLGVGVGGGGGGGVSNLMRGWVMVFKIEMGGKIRM